ncbi:methyl-accepting chemotaxis protein [Cytobacillus eiseniae]|uniref:Methyl-accepting chemotaxis protein n=1 Tax=Cytobacillus eiseniae TaxID=762947 RepID=A0ABS4RHL2_9BACI|nr:HAMP domain-containing methyl-accepting chemotaxis protein [Cytobacillus eiseniae]MBP2242397.1 methyl-accepting chemotaxis protein [Cytobacillus eiseniae]
MKWSIRKKIIMIFTAFLVLIGVISASSFVTSSKLNENAKFINTEVVPGIIQIGDINFATERYLTTAQKYILSSDSDYIDKFSKQMDEQEIKVAQMFDDYEKESLKSEKSKAIGQSLRNKWEAFLKVTNEARELKRRNQGENAVLQIYDAQELYDAMDNDVDTLLSMHKNQAADIEDQGTELYTTNTIAMLILVVISIVFVIAMVIFILRLIQKPIVKLADKFKQMATGDLTVGELQIKNRDEIGAMAASFNDMLGRLIKIVQSIDSNVVLVASTSEELAASAEETSNSLHQVTEAIMDISDGSAAQLESANTSSKVIQEIGKGMNQASQSVANVSNLAVETTEATVEGTSIMDHTMDKMVDIQRSSQSTAHIVSSLEQKSKEIERIVTLITDITNQTNLLALNAAIEAARAGEHGKGFAVVADEVRKLAEQSNGAAGEISSLIGVIRQEVVEANQAMEESLLNVESGIDMAKTSQSSFQEIARMVSDVSAQTEEISAVIEQVNASTQNMQQTLDEVAHLSNEASERSQNVAAAAEEQNATMEEISSSTNVLSQMADELRLIVNQFKL